METKLNTLNVCVVGLGYIGLPLAVTAAQHGLMLHGFDVDKNKVNAINHKHTYFDEPSLDIELHNAVSSGNLVASNEIQEADVYVVAVPTPIDQSNGQADLSFVRDAFDSIASVLKAGSLIIIESTCPVGTTDQMASYLQSSRTDLKVAGTSRNDDVHIAYCPERILPGQAMQELKTNSRIIGGLTSACRTFASEFYGSFVQGGIFEVTSPKTAEMIKLVENSFRDVNIAFANQLSLLCHELDCDVWEVIEFANKHPRVNILRPGAGVGGHCIAIDPEFLISKGSQRSTHLLAVAREVNNDKPKWVKEQLEEMISKEAKKRSLSARDLTIVFNGLTFKPDVEDTRESPAIEIVKNFTSEHNNKVYVTDPNLTEVPSDLVNKVTLADHTKLLNLGYIHVVLVAHKEYKVTRWDENVLLDICGIYSKKFHI